MLTEALNRIIIKCKIMDTNEIKNKVYEIVAGICGFKPEPFFEANEEERKNVEVKF